MMELQDLLRLYKKGTVNSVVCVQKEENTSWVLGKTYQVRTNAHGREGVEYIERVIVNPTNARFAVHSMKGLGGMVFAPNINPHMKDGKLPTLITGFNPNKVAVDDCKPVLSYKEIENIIRVGIDIQDALATNAPDLDRALVDLWFELKGTTK